MIEALAALAGIAPAALATAFLVFLRTGAALAVLPAFGERMIPARLRLGAAVALTMLVLPAVAPSVSDTLAAGRPLVALGGAEVLAGLALGLALRFAVIGLQIAGTMAAQATSLSQLLGGAAADPQPALGAVLVLGGLALATLLGLHVKLVAMFILSYALIPPGGVPAPDALSAWGVALAAEAFALALTLAAPFVIAAMVYNLALGVINRAMPQLMVAFVGAPAITFGALLLLALAAPLMLRVWAAALDMRLADPFGMP